MELFNDARVLNTAMTRAQSLVVVVGDASALCCFGKSSKIWKCYIDHCISKNSLEPKHLTKDFFESDIEEMSRFQRPEHSEVCDATDVILQQLKEEYDQCETDSGENNLDGVPNDGVKYSNNNIVGNYKHLQLCKSRPDIYKHGQLVIGSSNSGYVIPFDSPTKQVHLKGRKNLGRAFNGDEVVIERFSSDGIAQYRVSDIIYKADSNHVFVCTIEDPERHKRNENGQSYKFVRMIMVPIVQNSPKICTLILKKNWKRLLVWKQLDSRWEIKTSHNIDENLTQNHVFIVQVIDWKDGYRFPLGKVIDILPTGRSWETGLRILNKEFVVRHDFDYYSWQGEVEATASMNREDLCGIPTFTVDPEKAEDLDDAISIRNDGEQYEVGVHIADVASFVPPEDTLDENARHQGATYYTRQKGPCEHMFPKDLIKNDLSLLPGHDGNRRCKVVSLMVKVNKETHEIIGKPNFQLSVINSNKRMSYEEAEGIICTKIGQKPKFDTVDDCVFVAYHFAKAQRKIRLRNWAYAQTDKERVPGKRKAHLMIEELNVLFNTEASKKLTSTEDTRNCTPLRCQAKPDPKKLKQFKETYRELVPLSFHVRDNFEHDQQVAEDMDFYVLTKVWDDIRAAAKEGIDIDKIVDLIAADDIYPQLMPVLKEYKECLSKAYVIRSNSSPKAMVGHYSLKLTSYTYASSPIRRYIDVVLQRLLHTVICGTPVKYSPLEIDNLCEEFEKKMKSAKDYEKKAEMLNLAVNIKKQNVSKLAVVVAVVDQERECFRVSFPFDKDVFPDNLPIRYADLKLEDQPAYDKGDKCMTLKWKKRVYAFDNVKLSQELKRMQKLNGGYCTEIPATKWKAIVEAVENENWSEMKDLILGAKTNKLEHTLKITLSGEGSDLVANPCTLEEQHYKSLKVQLKPGDILQLQITSEVKNGFLTPTVQLMSLNDNLDICIDHAHSPINSFAKFAIHRTRSKYLSTEEYIKVWKPLCEMESVESAVDEGDSIIIEGLVVNFSKKPGGQLEGSFNLPFTHTKEWAIEFNLAKCLLCIRKRGLKPASTVSYNKAVDPSCFTWVVHGVTEKVEEMKEFRKVDFYINHLPMEIVPEGVFEKNTCFTVELIPKLLPDIRKESAVINIASASDLVQNIALGKHIPREAVQNSVPQYQLMKQGPKGLPKLNPSQLKAVIKALDNNFTLIQGPPGTGKTVVGVYIVYWFHELNARTNRKNIDPNKKEKKDVILYCGPSNKSVDVVAEYLLKCGDQLRPLRVYSQQVEMLDYPYPGSSLQLTHSALRQEKSKQKLRRITLHHRMRMDGNPFSHKIKEFDDRIKRWLQRNGAKLTDKEAEEADLTEEADEAELTDEEAEEAELTDEESDEAELTDEEAELTDEEVKDYKILLREARHYELKQHDIILCTCTAAPSPGLTKAVSARQILIDECAMATEPQALIPMVCNNPEKVILLGDHKQLRPIISNKRVGNLGMSQSLFERYFIMHEEWVMKLDTQYRMHEEICKFPSEAYYNDGLKTAVQPPRSLLLIDKSPKTIVFGHIIGEEISLVVSTKKGNEKSKANVAEQNKVVEIAQSLVKAKVKQKSIVILSPYNAQVSGIQVCLQKKNLSGITVTTITRSQGSEWRYVIISTVRSLPSKEIEKDPEPGWLSKHLGFVGDPNQINVGITRAKEGLCIIGNQELLDCSRAWHKLLNHYKAKSSVTTAERIFVAQR